MKKAFLVVLFSLLFISIPFMASAAENNEEVEGAAQVSEEYAPVSGNHLDNIAVHTFIIELSDKGKEKIKDLRKDHKNFIAALTDESVNLEDYGTMIAQPISLNIDVGKRIETRQDALPVIAKVKDREIVVGSIDNGLKFNLEYISHEGNDVTLNSEVVLLDNWLPENAKSIAVPEIRGQYLTFAQKMPVGVGVIVGGFQKLGTMPSDELKDLVVIQIAYAQ